MKDNHTDYRQAFQQIHFQMTCYRTHSLGIMLTMQKKNTIFTGQLLEIETWEQTLRNGRVTKFERVVRKPTVSIIAKDGGYIYFIREYRYEKECVVEKFPAGFVDEGERIEDAAQRELQEEMGLKAGKLTLIAKTEPLTTCHFPEFVFLAEDLTPSILPCDDGEEILEVKKSTIPEIGRKIINDEFYYSFTSFIFLKYFCEDL